MLLRRMVQYLGKAISLALHLVFLILFLRFFIIEPGAVNGQSMEPTLRDEDFLLVNKISPLVRPLQRGNIVQLFLKNNDDMILVKRIVGLPGETVILQDGGVVVRNGQGMEKKLAEPYLRKNIFTKVPEGKPKQIQLAPFYYFVLGDNRGHSLDSRYFGPVHRRDIVGTVLRF